MAVMTLPTVIVAVEESLHSVPPDFREASLALGATRWQAVRTTVIPHALPGVFTGAILATGRAAGEVAPILFTGAAYYLPESIPGLSDQFMALGYHLYVMATQSVDIEGTRGIQAATALVLLSLTAGLGLLAALLRARLRQRSGR
jgi:phosphate transport system permease protein